MKREANFTILFRHWLKANPMPSAAFELKQTRKDYISFSSVKEHQIDALNAAKRPQGITYKISDESSDMKPFDMFHLSEVAAYVVIKFPKFFCLIDVTTFCVVRELSERKSLTSQRAKEIAEKTIHL